MAASGLAEQLVGARRPPSPCSPTSRHAPYNRILLSAVLEGTHSADALTLRSPAWFAGEGASTCASVPACWRSTARQREVVLVDGERLAYDRLVLATGAIPTLPPIRGLVRRDGTLHPKVHPFRSLEDCRRLDAAVTSLVERGREPGPSSSAAASSGSRSPARCRSAGSSPRSSRAPTTCSPARSARPAARVLARDLRRLGTDVYTGARAVRLTDDGAPARQRRRPADRPGRAHRRRPPSTALARRAGLMVGRGIVVDSTLTSVTDDRIHAIGDCAEHRRPYHRLRPARLGAGRGAGTRACAVRTRRTTASAASRASARPAWRSPSSATRSPPTARWSRSTNPIAGSHRRLVVHGGRIVAAALVGDLSRVGLITQLYDRGTILGPDEPGQLLLPEAADAPTPLPDEAEVCACAGVTAGGDPGLRVGVGVRRPHPCDHRLRWVRRRRTPSDR